MDPSPRALTVWFDADCSFCTRAAAWLQAQPKFVPLQCVAAQSATAAGCPLDLHALLEKVTVTAADGSVWRGSNAWIVVLWALRDWRAMSLRFARPAWRPLAERLFGAITGVAARTKRRRVLRPASGDCAR